MPVKSHKARVRRVLLAAAKRVEEGRNTQACYAITEAAESNKIPDWRAVSAARHHFCALFSPYWSPNHSGKAFWDKRATPERQRMRADALILAAYSYEGEN